MRPYKIHVPASGKRNHKGRLEDLRKDIHPSMIERRPSNFEVTLSEHPSFSPEVSLDLTVFSTSLNGFDEVHLYHVYEHLFTQGDSVSFFRFWNLIHSMLQPGGRAFVIVPYFDGDFHEYFKDPDHKRIVSEYEFNFLTKFHYEVNLNRSKTACSNYPAMYEKDGTNFPYFKILGTEVKGNELFVYLEKD